MVAHMHEHMPLIRYSVTLISNKPVCVGLEHQTPNFHAFLVLAAHHEASYVLFDGICVNSCHCCTIVDVCRDPASDTLQNICQEVQQHLLSRLGNLVAACVPECPQVRITGLHLVFIHTVSYTRTNHHVTLMLTSLLTHYQPPKTQQDHNAYFDRVAHYWHCCQLRCLELVVMFKGNNVYCALTASYCQTRS